ncbi:MAG: hypothetical protein A3H28_10470 [Acidobacteria bacterium RIFCSPLOWO2_02_FULL_61_28]|nr:MAG: hypothetical protein A3H28_10470 [Acidobacteria bacterium RIFCSPLOWO2_02_FULL_61_28]
MDVGVRPGGNHTLLGVLLICFAPMLSAQTTGTISGVVTDVSGAVMPGVAVQAISQPGRTVQNAVTDDSGRYRIEGLTTGSYELSFGREGFETARKTLLFTTESAVLDVTLGLSGLSTTIVVREVAGTVADITGKTTASRMDIPDRELPVQVSSIPQQVLVEQGVNDMVTALRNASGVSAVRKWGMYDYYTIRGFHVGDRGTDVQLVDGMRLEGNRFSTQLNNVEQIDVLKGPSSILYGGQALGGAINIIRKKPQAERLYELFYRGGRFNTHQVGGGATGRVFGSNRLLYRTDVSYENSSGWREAGARRLNVTPVLSWFVTDRIRLAVHQAFNRDDFDGDAGVPVGVLDVPGFDLSRRFNTPQDFARLRDSQTQLLFSVDLSSNFKLRNSFFYRWTNDQYFTAEGLSYVPRLNQVNREFLYFQHHRRPVQNQTDVTGRFDLFGMRHTFLIGYEYEDFFNITDRSTSRSVSTTPVNLTTFAETHVFFPEDFPLSRADYFSNRYHAFFWQDQIALTNRLKINVGGRLDDYLRRAHNDPWANGQRVSRGPEQRRSQTPYTYRTGVVYTLTEGQEAYFGAASAFRPVETVPADGRELEPETGRSYEIGHRWRGLNGRFTVNSALYRIVRNNVVIALGNQRFDQAGQQSSKGVDLDINGEIGRGIRLVANYGYTLPRFDKYFESNGTLDLSGFRPQFTQRHAANLWITRSWKSGLTASVGTRYLSSVFTDNANTIRLGGWTTFSGALGFRRSFYDWSLNAENLFNRQRYFVAQINSNQVYPGAPINVFTKLVFRFR